MVEMINKMETSRWWWFDSHYNGSKRSPWLQSTLSELDRKTKGMLKLIEEDADSFAKRAEMYYKKRPELISLVEDFYRAHRSLAERYDQVKSDPGTRLVTTLGSPFSSIKCSSEKTRTASDKTYDSYSESLDTEDYAESEVDDPEDGDLTSTEEQVEDPKPDDDKYETETMEKSGDVEDEVLIEQEAAEEVLSEACDDAVVMKLREEIERLKEENKVQKAELLQKDEEKREVIRQMSLAVQLLKEENKELRTRIGKESPMKWSPIEFTKQRGGFLGMLFRGSSKSHATSVVAL